MLLFTMVEHTFVGQSTKEKKDGAENLLAQIGKDNQEAFRKLYQMHAKTVYVYALSILKNHHNAEEVMQDTFLKIRSAAHLYRPMGKPLAWILQIAKNYCMMQLRKESRYSDSSMEDVGNMGLLSYEMDEDDRIILQAALEILEEEERSIILLHAVTGQKHKEIAKNLGKPLSTVLSKYHRGLKKLRNYLGERGLH